MRVVTFHQFRPPPRFDDEPWRQVRVEESPRGTGETRGFSGGRYWTPIERYWTPIDTLELSPIDSDPADPARHDLTTTNATLERCDALYRLVFIDAATNESEPFIVTSDNRVYATVAAITPTVADVSKLLYDMLVREGGQPTDSFDATTEPTDEQIQFVIDQAVGEILGRLRTAVPDDPKHTGLARWVATIHAARLALTLFNTERTDEPAANTKLDTLFNAVWPDLLAACRAPARLRLA
jgi:hypothetical protein